MFCLISIFTTQISVYLNLTFSLGLANFSEIPGYYRFTQIAKYSGNVQRGHCFELPGPVITNKPIGKHESRT